MNLATTRPSCRLPLFAVGCLLAFSASSRSEPEANHPRCLADLQRLSPCELRELFLRGTANCVPPGDVSGKVLYMADKHSLRVRTSNLLWRGKHVSDDAYFTNLWIGKRRMIGVQSTVGPSWVDGKPAILLDYPAGTPVFSGMHDEIREIAPGLYIGLVYSGGCSPCFRAYFALETSCCQR